MRMCVKALFSITMEYPKEMCEFLDAYDPSKLNQMK